MTIPPEFLPVVQITLPLLGGMWLASHVQNKRIDDLRGDMNRGLDLLRGDMNRGLDLLRDDMNRGFNQVTRRLDSIDEKLAGHGERIAKLEERIPPLVHR